MPYEQHERFITPENQDSPIWRYMSFTKLIALLTDNALYFARADKLAAMDAFEGRYTHVNAAILNANWDMAPPEFWAEKNIHSEDELKRFIEIQKMSFGNTASLMREINFINCWHMGEDESDAMWKLYSATQDGVCIQSTFRAFADSFTDTEDPVYIGKVQYLDYTKDAIDEGMVFAPFLSKRRAFRHEQELRAIIWRMKDTGHAYFHRDGSPATAEDYQNAQFINKYPDRYGLKVPVDVSRLISVVYVSPGSAKWFKDLVQLLINKLGYEFEIRESNLAAAPPV